MAGSLLLLIRTDATLQLFSGMKGVVLMCGIMLICIPTRDAQIAEPFFLKPGAMPIRRNGQS